MGVPFEIDLFGKFRLLYRGKPVNAMNSPRVQELLAYLIVHRDAPQQRQHIALHFWPESPAKQTLANLRQLLYQLRNALPEPDTCILADSNTLQWNPGSPCTIDLVEFEQSISRAPDRRREEDIDGEIAALEQAVTVYGGPLLPHCYEEWITGRRHRLQEQYIDALERLTELHEQRREYGKSILYARKMMEQEPTDESAARKLMRLHALNDDRASVVRIYKKLEEKMREELDIEPGRETVELFRRLKERDKIEPGPDKEEAGPDGAPYLPESGEDWPLVGREEEWRTMLDVWSRARSGVMQCILIRGEPGTGKSRLGHELLAHLDRQGYPAAGARCHESPGTPGYGPPAEWLRSAPFRSYLDELEPVWRAEIDRLLPELGAGRESAGTPASGQNENKEEKDREPWKQSRFEEALARAVLAGGKPAVLMLDGLQWCDHETLGWLNYLLHRNRPAPLLLVATLRTAAGTPVAGDALEHLLLSLSRKHSLHEIELGPLDQTETAELAARILDHEIGGSMGNIIYKETEGNPLFIVETAREIHLLEELQGRDPEEFTPPDQRASRIRSLPRVVSDVISNRFRHLSGEAREVLGIASVAGRGFSFNLLSRCCDLDESGLVDLLEELVGQHILREPEPERYEFRHDKLREVAYKKLGETRKRRLHLLLAKLLPEIGDGDPPELHRRIAFHYERAGVTADAVDHYRHAAGGEAGGNRVRQDIGMLRRALDLLSSLPEGEDSDNRELDISRRLSLAMLQRKHVDTGEVFRVCEQVHRLCNKLGEPPPPDVLMALGIANLRAGDPKTATELGTVMHTLAGEGGDNRVRMEACYLLGLSGRISGNIEKSAEWYREGLEAYENMDDGARKPLVHLQGYDLTGSILFRMEAACAMVLTDDEAGARKRIEQALKEARGSEQAADLAGVHFKTAWLETLLRRPAEVREAVEQFLAMEVDVEPLQWTVQAGILRGWSMAAGEKESSGLGSGRIRQGIELLEQDGYILDLPFYYVLLGEVLTGEGEYEEAAAALDRAREIMNDTGAWFAEAELQRAGGELLLAREPDGTEEARAAFSGAIETARRQGCRLFESRAAEALEKTG